MKTTACVKEHLSFAHCRRGLLGRMSRHRTAMARAELKIRCQKEHAVEQELHGCAPKEAVHLVTAAAVLDGHDGLCSLRIVCKSASCVKLTCVINTDLVAISYVNGSRYLVVVTHEVIISMVSEARLGMCKKTLGVLHIFVP